MKKTQRWLRRNDVEYVRLYINNYEDESIIIRNNYILLCCIKLHWIKFQIAYACPMFVDFSSRYIISQTAINQIDCPILSLFNQYIKRKANLFLFRVYSTTRLWIYGKFDGTKIHRTHVTGKNM